MPPRTRARAFCFTLHDYTEEDKTRIKAIVCEYLIMGYEMTHPSQDDLSNGVLPRPHIQGYVHFASPKDFNTVKSMLGNKAHIERANGSAQQNREYCSKEGDFFEQGTLPSQGKRKDLEECRDAIKNGLRGKLELIEQYPSIVARYPQFIEECIDVYSSKPPAPVITLKPWQADIVEMLKDAPHDRKIIFVVDHLGGAGKTTFSKYLCSTLEKVQILRPGKIADMAYELNRDTRIVIVDVPRSQMEFLQYQFLEYCKDAIVPCNKYRSCSKVFPLPLHVLVLCNEQPDTTKLSQDRFFIMTIQ